MAYHFDCSVSETQTRTLQQIENKITKTSQLIKNNLSALKLKMNYNKIK